MCVYCMRWMELTAEYYKYFWYVGIWEGGLEVLLVGGGLEVLLVEEG